MRGLGAGGAAMMLAGSPARAAITGMKTWGSSGSGYVNNSPGTITQTFTLKASNTDPATTSWTGTTIGAITPFTNAFSAQPKDTLGNANATRYRYVWLEMAFSPAAFQAFLAEVEFYETIGGVETLIDDAALTKINDNMGVNTANAFDGSTANFATSTSSGASSTSICRIGLDLGA